MFSVNWRDGNGWEPSLSFYLCIYDIVCVCYCLWVFCTVYMFIAVSIAKGEPEKGYISYWRYTHMYISYKIIFWRKKYTSELILWNTDYNWPLQNYMNY